MEVVAASASVAHSAKVALVAMATTVPAAMGTVTRARAETVIPVLDATETLGLHAMSTIAHNVASVARMVTEATVRRAASVVRSATATVAASAESVRNVANAAALATATRVRRVATTDQHVTATVVPHAIAIAMTVRRAVRDAEPDQPVPFRATTIVRSATSNRVLAARIGKFDLGSVRLPSV